ncbi:hypothetical protein [Paenibacillus elgii]|uniref:hypothetical protein n=1 Tax=Paenibacillus elgii TaxID=189691 RepID=UPI000FD7EA95|nr:hypothetical protein [Paenibacillus elgii]NEN84347.1 hypothetical protein [Paenibacillus elgii]
MEVPWLFYNRTLFFLQRFNIGFHTKLAAIKNVDAMLKGILFRSNLFICFVLFANHMNQLTDHAFIVIEAGMNLAEFVVYFLEFFSELGAHALDLGFHVGHFRA